MTSEVRARDLFVERFGPLPAVMVRVPGRVILAGEHTDHSMLPVLAMTIDRAIFVAASESAEPGIQAVSAEFEGLARIEPGTHSAHGWAKQLEAALSEVGAGINRGARIAIASDLPANGGLASSAALMIGVVAALNALWNLGWDRPAIAATAARAERRLGVETSGVDHSVITSGAAGMAVHVDMQPFAQRFVPVPADWALILASSGDTAGRADMVRRAYAERVVGTRMAAAMLAEMIGLDPNQTLLLGDVSDTDVIDLLAEELPVKQTIKEVARATEVLPARLGQLSHSQFETQVPVLVRGPALHVLSEAQRVGALEAAMAAGDGAKAGALFVESHTSLRDDFACSTPALNNLIKAMGKAGAWGAKVTGSGFGGYALAVAAPDTVNAVLEAAIATSGGPAFVVHAADGWRID